MLMEKDFYTTGEVSRILGISERTIRNYCDKKKLGCQQTPVTNYRRIPGKSLIRFMKENCLPIEQLNQVTGMKVLIVDDEEDMVDVFSQMVSADFENVLIETASDGYEACIKAGIFTPDLVILDLKMPKADGFEVCKNLRLVEQTRHAEIIVVSGYLDEESIIKLETFNIKHMLKKPVRKAELLKAINQLFYTGKKRGILNHV